MVRRYWIELEQTIDKHVPGTLAGVGVTAYTKEDAMKLVQARIFQGNQIPPIRRFKVDISIGDLDPKHVVPNMRDPSKRGIWFPAGY